MLFNSIEFLVFLVIVFSIYWFVLKNNTRLQNIMLLGASYVFYGWWNWKLLFLLLGISLSGYLIGLKLGSNQSEKKRTAWFLAGLILNIGTLCIFKYLNFFVDSFIDLVGLSGYKLSYLSTSIVLPIGISFYIFLSLSYLLDIYKGKMNAEKNMLNVLLSLSFFPIILAGPIHRPSSLIPQIEGKREFDYDNATDALRQILWGLFKKVFLADTCAANADYIFNNHSSLSGLVLVFGAVNFAFQLYGDFSGYSDMAIGIGRLFGFNLVRNFAFPYFARDIASFWQKWHISLTTWFRDYVFLPLSIAVGTRFNKERILGIKQDLFIYIVAALITWFLTGLWHGANYTYLVWGMIHGVFLILYHWQKMPRKRFLKKTGLSNDHLVIVFSERVVTMAVVLLAWVFFRASSVHEAFRYLADTFSHGIFSLSIMDLRGRGITSTLIDASIAMAVVLLIEWIQRDKQHGLAIANYPSVLRWGMYWSLTFVCLVYLGGERTFIYFQF
jgi:alginate O-acetyltransferase complex protein AlgI